MSADIHLAFEHPDARSHATASATPLDRISVRDHVVHVEIGAFHSERGVTQRVVFNIVVEVQPITAPLADDVDRILSYDKVTEAIDLALAEERLNLLETLAERVAALILAAPQAVRTIVRIEKLDRAPGALGVEIVRSRLVREVPEPSVQDASHPVVVFLSNKAILGENLSMWLDGCVALDRPIVLCVGMPDRPMPQARHPMAQRRIDLLAIEQNAWILASLDARCKVVGTRTELDWAMKDGQICVWAPSKTVLDAVDPPACEVRNGVGLAGWFAGSIGADRIVVVDAAPDPAVPLEQLCMTSEDTEIPM